MTRTIAPTLSPRAAAVLELLALVVDQPRVAERDSGLRVLGTADVARLLGISTGAVRELARRRKIPMERIVGSYRILETDFVAWVRGQTPGAAVEPARSSRGVA